MCRFVSAQMVISLQNTTSTSRHLRVLPPSTPYFALGLGELRVAVACPSSKLYLALPEVASPRGSRWLLSLHPSCSKAASRLPSSRAPPPQPDSSSLDRTPKISSALSLLCPASLHPGSSLRPWHWPPSQPSCSRDSVFSLRTALIVSPLLPRNLKCLSAAHKVTAKPQGQAWPALTSQGAPSLPSHPGPWNLALVSRISLSLLHPQGCSQEKVEWWLLE